MHDEHNESAEHVESAEQQGAAVTREAYDDLLVAYNHFNEELFEGKLPGAIITLQRKKRCYGYYSRKRWVSARNKGVADEIALNPSAFASRPIEAVLSTLCHEQVHQWQSHFGESGRRGYHNREFAEKMKALGLQTSSTGRIGGKEVGERMTHFIIPDGPFIKSVQRLLETDFTLSWLDRYPMAADYTYVPTDEDLRELYPDEYGPDETEVEQLNRAQIEAPLLAPVLDIDGLTPIEAAVPTATERPEKSEDGEGGEGNALSDQDASSGARGAEPASATPKTPPRSRMTLSAPPSAGGLDLEPQRAAPGAQEPNQPQTRVKFCCPGCRDAAWGKPSLKLVCGKCTKPMTAKKSTTESTDSSLG